MSLSTRLSGFFLLALALVLGAFSVTLYLLARSHFQRDLDERLTGAIDTLTESVEVDSDEVEWKPRGRLALAGVHPQDHPVHWAVFDGLGTALDHCWDLRPQDLAKISSSSPDAGHIHDAFTDQDGREWRLVVRRILTAGSRREALESHDHSATGTSGRAATSAKASPSLILAAGALSGPMEADLRRVALTLTGLSMVIWLLAALMGRRLSRRALLPVTRMARIACSMSAADRDQRLPSPGTDGELDALARSFNGLLDRLHEALERQRRFTGDASHQLRTPLAAVLGQIEVTLRRDRTAEEYRRTLEDIHGEAVQLGQIVDALLFMARAEAEAGQPDLQPVELALWVHDYLRGWSGHDRAVDLHEDVEPGATVWVRAHPPLLGQLLDNLLNNACKYSAPGSPIHIRLEREGDRAALSVHDQGVGLPATELPHIFEPFYRTAEARRRGQSGVGLGLSVVRRIAGVLGGTIDVSSQPGRGSRFVLYLPIANEAKPVSGPALCPDAALPAGV
jgi:two-component system OmpR family sensor kinase